MLLAVSSPLSALCLRSKTYTLYYLRKKRGSLCGHNQPMNGRSDGALQQQGSARGSRLSLPADTVFVRSMNGDGRCRRGIGFGRRSVVDSTPANLCCTLDPMHSCNKKNTLFYLRNGHNFCLCERTGALLAHRVGFHFRLKLFPQLHLQNYRFVGKPTRLQNSELL